jgi:uncharacterized membrane protein
VGVRPRLDSIDLLRGLVMVVMALDHARDFFGASSLDPDDPTQPVLFLTRWSTHFCAPVFVFLAGSSAFLYGTRGKTTRDVSRFLLTRGLWLVVLELTVVRFGWLYAFDLQLFPAQVIWAIGWSMVTLSLLVFLPRWAILGFAIAMIAGHNAFDGVEAARLGAFGWAWVVLHQGGPLELAPDVTLLVAYPLIPWLGVIAAGYALGPAFLLDAPARRGRLLRTGLGACALFVFLRALDVYGDPQAWAFQGELLTTALSFVNTEKYPPSLLFLLMTLGPSIALLPALEHARGRLARTLVTIGRVPLMYYVVHILLLHAVALAVARVTFGDVGWLLGGWSFLTKPSGYGVGLPVVYALWLLVVVSLLPLCRWFAAVKQRRHDWWLSYL